MPGVTRRGLLVGASMVALTMPVEGAPGTLPVIRARPIPASQVRLTPSIFADAAAANRRYLLSLDAERLLHNFYLSAGLPAPKPVYGGWESRGIAGHTLGHWLSACSLVVANTGDRQATAALDHALAEMARIQAAHGDGYCGGTTVDRKGKTIDGKVVFEEVRRGDIRTQGFDLNGGWVPLYTWHKVQAGVLDAYRLASNRRALPIALGLATYLAGVLEPLSDTKMQQVLRAEHGGLNESFAEMYALTGNPRWLRMSEKIRHRAVLDPLSARQDRLAGLHANTQIPKLVGLARLHEVTGDPSFAVAPRFFHDTVTQHHSYVIGGNSEREHFSAPDCIAGAITEATCEACNSYNMLRLTRHLYAWAPHGSWFDQYERIQLNHIMAHQRPDTGQFVYFMPLAAGARRSYSTAEESFWCCVGTGMESHAKHADSIYWEDGRTLFVNLYTPNRLDWRERGLALELATGLPFDGVVDVTIGRAPRRTLPIAFRVPGWADGASVTVGDQPVHFVARDGYAVVERQWRAGDRIRVTLPMRLRAEPTPDDPNLVAFTRGPLVLAADLGPADRPFEAVGPALLTDGDASRELHPVAGGRTYIARSATGEALSLKPFFAQYDRRTAVYFPTFTPARWAAAKDDYLRAQADARDLARRTVDVLYLGEMQPERDHGFEAARSEAVQVNGRSSRRLGPNDTMRFTLARPPGPAMLRVICWGGDVGQEVVISMDGTPVTTDRRNGPARTGFIAVDHPLPATRMAAGGTSSLEFKAIGGDAHIYEVRTLTAADAARESV